MNIFAEHSSAILLNIRYFFPPNSQLQYTALYLFEAQKNSTLNIRYMMATQYHEESNAWMKHAKFKLIEILTASSQGRRCLHPFISHRADPNLRLPIGDDRMAIMFLVCIYPFQASIRWMRVD